MVQVRCVESFWTGGKLYQPDGLYDMSDEDFATVENTPFVEVAEKQTETKPKTKKGGE